MDHEFKCQRCGYLSDKVANLKNHFRRKQGCRDILNCGKTIQELVNELGNNFDFVCECNEKFNTKQGLHQHRRLCKEYNNFNDKTYKLIEENKRLKEELKNATQIINNTTNNNITNNNTTNNNITNNNTINNYTTNNNIIIVYDFENEDVSYVVKDDVFLKKCINNLISNGIESIIKRIYFDPEHPENHTIKMQNIKENQVLIREKNEWLRSHLSYPVSKMINKGKSILYTFYNESGELQKNIDRFLEEGSNELDKKREYLDNVGLSYTSEYKEAVYKVKGVISNYRLDKS